MKRILFPTMLLAAVFLPLMSQGQSTSSLSASDREEIESLATRYFEVLANCDAEGFADLFVPETGYFASGFRGKMIGRERLMALVKSERHCNVPAGTAPAARTGDSNRPSAVLESTNNGVRGLTDMGTAKYEDEYAKTAQGWRIAARAVIIAAESAVGIDANELNAIHTLLGPALIDHYVANADGINHLMTVGASIRVTDGAITGRSYVAGGGYNDDVYEKVSPGNWRIKSRTFVPAEAP